SRISEGATVAKSQLYPVTAHSGKRMTSAPALAAEWMTLVIQETFSPMAARNFICATATESRFVFIGVHPVAESLGSQSRRSPSPGRDLAPKALWISLVPGSSSRCNDALFCVRSITKRNLDGDRTAAQSPWHEAGLWFQPSPLSPEFHYPCCRYGGVA